MTKRLLMVMLLALMGYQSVHALTRNEAFTTLGLPTTATEQEIRAAYKKLSLQYHPNMNKPTADAAMFRKVKDAHDLLLGTGTTWTPEATSSEGDTPARSLRKKYNSYLRNEERTPKTLKDIKNLCNGPDLRYSTDPEVRNICTMIPLIEKISNSHALTVAEKIQVMKDPGAKDFYEGKATDEIARIDAEIKKPIGTRDPEYFYLKHEAALDVLTPGTSSTILDLYSAAIEEYARRKEHHKAEQIAQKAQLKAQTLEAELRDMGMASAEFVTARRKLNQAINDSKNPDAEAARERAEEQARRKAGVKPSELEEAIRREQEDEEAALNILLKRKTKK